MKGLWWGLSGGSTGSGDERAVEGASGDEVAFYKDDDGLQRCRIEEANYEELHDFVCAFSLHRAEF